MKTKEQIKKEIKFLEYERDKETAEGVRALFNIEINKLRWVLND